MSSERRLSHDHSYSTISTMSYNLTITETAFRQIVNQLTSHPNRIILCYAGLSRLTNRTEFLVHDISHQPSQGNSALIVVGSSNPAHLAMNCLHALRQHEGKSMVACLAIGISDAVGNIAGICKTPHGIRPLDNLKIVGSGLLSISFSSEGLALLSDIRNLQPEIWSRTIGALGEATWQRLTSLKIGIVGCGRSGSLVATSLARFGAQHLTLIDPDNLEPHNIGEMNGVTLDDIGCPKVDALAKSLPVKLLSHPIAESVLSLHSLVAVKGCDVLICCVDNASARLSTAFLAKLYLKPLLDIGTGIFYETTTRQMGADIRLVLPDRCLLCFGGIADLEQARTELLNPQPSSPIAHPDWRRQRAGSLRSLNTCAVGFALRLLEDFIGGRIRESTWLHLEIDDDGIPTLERRTQPANNRCPLCAFTGQGDEGLYRLKTILERL